MAAARLVEELAEAVGARHVVVGGDFNADPGASSVAFWRGERSLEGTSVCYLDTWERARPGDMGHTFTPRNPLVSEQARSWTGAQDGLPSLALRGLPVRPHA